MLSYTQIRTWLAAQMHEDVADTVLTTTLFLRWINEAAQEIATAATWAFLEGQQELLLGTHGAGTNTSIGITYFPSYVHRLLSVWPSGQGYRKAIQIIGGWELDAMSPSVISGTVTDYLAVWGYYSVARDNPTAGVLAVADTGATAAQVRIEGIDNNGLEASETVTMAAGAANSTTQFAAGPDGVRRIFVLDDGLPAGVGVVTVASGGTVIETINAGVGERIHERLRTELSPAPVAAGQNHIVRYYKRIRQVLSTDDVVDVPFEFDDLLMLGMGRKLAEFRGEQDMALYYTQMFRSRVQDLKKWQNRQPGRMRGVRRVSSYGYQTSRGY